MLSIVIDGKNIVDDNAIINDISDIKHIVNVYRLNVNDKIRLVDGSFEYIGIITGISKKSINIKIEEKLSDKYSLKLNIDIAMGIIKNDNMKLAIKKLTEIGVNKIIPLKTERVVVKINEKKDKWEDVIKEAMKQCRAVKKTKLDSIKTLKDIDLKEYDKILYLYESSNKALKINEAISQDDKNVLCIVGPEGGFTKNEVNFMSNNNMIEINLGNRILRAETAAILVSSVISHIFGY